MDKSQEAVEETAESVNPMDLDPLVSGSSGSARSEHASTEALLKIYQDMARVLDRLTTPRASIDSVRKHGVEGFHGTSLEEFDKAEFWLEKLQRALDEVKCPPEQMAKCAVSLLQGVAYDWWKLVLRIHCFQTQFHETSLSKSFKQSVSLMTIKRPSGSNF